MSLSDLSEAEELDFWTLSSSDEDSVRLVMSREILSEYQGLLKNFTELPLDLIIAESDRCLEDKIISCKPDLLILDDHFLNQQDRIHELFYENCFLSSYQAIIYICKRPVDISKYRYRQGIEYLQTPFSTSQLLARIHHKIDVISLLKNMGQELSLLRQEKLVAQEDTLLVGRYIDNLSQLDRVLDKNFRETIMPFENLSGDLVLTAVNPHSEQFFLLADFTGHGLPAAVGSIIISGIFHSMVSKGFSENDLVYEINHKLKSFYPTGRYMAASFLKINHDKHTVEILNCGMPEVLFYSSDENKVYEYESVCHPLGIVKNHELDLDWKTQTISHGDRLIAYTDGLTDSSNKEANNFGKERVLEAILSARDDYHFTDVILEKFNLFADGNQPSDDVSLLEVFLDQQIFKPEVIQKFNDKKIMDWSLTLDVKSNMLKEDINPVTLFLQYVCDLQGLGHHRDTLYTILSELYINSLEHGILELDSAIKEQTNGFILYYEAKEERLKDLQKGEVVITIENKAVDEGGELTITVHDNGSGFNLEKIETKERNDELNSGRGIYLVRSLTKSLEYFDNGRKAIAVYSW